MLLDFDLESGTAKYDSLQFTQVEARRTSLWYSALLKIIKVRDFLKAFFEWFAGLLGPVGSTIASVIFIGGTIGGALTWLMK